MTRQHQPNWPRPMVDLVALADAVERVCEALAELSPEQLTAITDGIAKIIEAKRAVAREATTQEPPTGPERGA